VGEWGLSIYIEVNGMKILFDTGESGGLLNNADVMGIDLESVEALVLSHGHYDHTGGMRSFLRCKGVNCRYARTPACMPAIAAHRRNLAISESRTGKSFWKALGRNLPL